MEDIDLYVAGNLEKPYKDSTVGATFTCLLGAQYHQWKFGDRLYFEFPSAKFTQCQYYFDLDNTNPLYFLVIY